MNTKQQSGFAVIEIVLVLVVVAVLGFTAYTVMGHQPAATDTAMQQSPQAKVSEAPQVNSTADLTAAETTLDQMDLEATNSDSAELDRELNAF